jgi:hypothetical protein
MASGRLSYDYTLPGKTRTYLDCPVTGYRREVLAIELADGGRLTFANDFSSKTDPESINEAPPKITALRNQKVG